MKKYTQEEFNLFPVDEYGIKNCPTGDYSLIKKIPEQCSFAEGCSFAEWCSFAERCSFAKWCSFAFFPVSILRCWLYELPPTLTLELMRRDAWAHPKPEMFDIWADGGPCPYESDKIERLHFFQEKRSLWSPGPPTMKDSDLIIAICKEKNWVINWEE